MRTRSKVFRGIAYGLAGALATVAFAGATANADTYHYLTARSEVEDTNKALLAAVEAYRQDHPDFNITVESIPDRPAFLQKVQILATSNQLPELFDADATPYFQEMVDTGLVADAQAILDELGVTDRFFKAPLDYERLPDGRLYLLPLQANTEYFWYHPSLFEQAGVEVPTTLDGILEACDQFTAAGITPIAVDGMDGWPIYRYLSFPAFRLTGNQFLEDLKDGKVSMNDPVGLASSQYLQDVGTRCFQEGFTATDYTTALDLFMSGQAAMYYIGTWQLSSMLNEDGTLKDDIAYFPLPIIEGETATLPTDWYEHGGIGLAIKAGADTDELKDFIKFFAENYGDIALYDFNVLPSVTPTIRPNLPQVTQDILTDLENVQTYVKVWDVLLDPNTVDVMFRQSQLLALGQITPEQFGTALDEAIQQYVSQQ
jgi:raffinose/stachyose/melibiose transport system substrate-binding protein